MLSYLTELETVQSANLFQPGFGTPSRQVRETGFGVLTTIGSASTNRIDSPDPAKQVRPTKYSKYQAYALKPCTTEAKSKVPDWEIKSTLAQG